jgi:hypothetical protein
MRRVSATLGLIDPFPETAATLVAPYRLVGRELTPGLEFLTCFLVAHIQAPKKLERLGVRHRF